MAFGGHHEPACEDDRLGTLELLGAAVRLAHWRYTNGRARARARVRAPFDAVRRGLPPELTEHEEAEAFASPPPEPVSTRALWRLARFARQRRE